MRTIRRSAVDCGVVVALDPLKFILVVVANLLLGVLVLVAKKVREASLA